MPKEGETGARLTCGDIELAFVWTKDRFTHTVYPRASSSPTEARSTLDSTEHADFETPVFQEVHQQGDLVFASGMSGDRHWSASIEASEDGFLFDVACRCKTLAAAIGSAYQLPGEQESGLHVIGKAINDAPPAEPRTVGTTITIETHPTVEPPATYRYRYAIVSEGSHWIKECGGGQ